jgi:hypothetical protein
MRSLPGEGIKDAARFLSRCAALAALGLSAGVAINGLVESMQQNEDRRSRRLLFIALQYALCMLTVYVLLQYSLLNVSRDGQGNFSNVFFTVIFFTVQSQMARNVNAELAALGINT